MMTNISGKERAIFFSQKDYFFFFFSIQNKQILSIVVRKGNILYFSFLHENEMLHVSLEDNYAPMVVT